MTGRSLRTAFVLFILINILVRFGIAIQSYYVIPQNSPVQPDAFYYYGIARNIVSGHGVTHDGTAITNGFQPLYQFILLPVFYISPDPFKAINYSLFLAIIFFTGIAFLLYRLLKSLFGEFPAILAVLLWMSSPIVTKNMFNGMETSLSVFLGLISIYYYIYYFRPLEPAGLGAGKSIIMGILVGLLYLARFDNLVLVAILLLDYGWLNRKRLGQLICLKFGLSILVALLMAGPWIYFSFSYFGSFMPKSGDASRLIAKYATTLSAGELSLLNIKTSIFDGFFSSDPLMGALYLAAGRLFDLHLSFVASLPFILVGILIIVIFVWKSRRGNYVALASILISYMLSLMIIYPCFMPVGWFYTRYFAFFSIVFVSAYASIFKLISELGPRHSLFLSLPVGLISLFLVSTHVHYVKKSPPHMAYQRSIEWIKENTTPGEDKIGIFQAEIIPYYIDNDFVNLDGKCNVNAMRAIRNKRMLQFIQDEEIDYVLDRESIINTLLFKRSEKDSTGAFSLMKRYKGSGETWVIFKVNDSQ